MTELYVLGYYEDEIGFYVDTECKIYANEEEAFKACLQINKTLLNNEEEWFPVATIHNFINPTTSKPFKDKEIIANILTTGSYNNVRYTETPLGYYYMTMNLQK